MFQYKNSNRFTFFYRIMAHPYIVTFFPRDAMLARVLAMGLCMRLSVCLSVTSRCSIERGERINLFFGMKTSFDQSYTVF